MRTSSYTTEQQSNLLSNLREFFETDRVSRKDIDSYVSNHSISYPWFIFKDERKISRGVFSIAENDQNQKVAKRAAVSVTPQPVEAVVAVKSKITKATTDSFVPEKDDTYTSFGFFNDLKKIISSKQFYPVYITGLSGNGKTMMVDQVCAHLGREMIRANIVKTTDETDLIGSYELIDGNTILREGPVIVAMRRGAVLLLDEVDLGSEHLLCLQPILEGKPYFNKKTGEVVHPAPGFNIVATANTKGKGSDDGRFIGTNMLNEAFLERFAITVEQEYAPNSVETKILLKNFEKLGLQEPEFAERLVLWAELIRKSFSDGAVDEIVSTRRLVHIARAYSIFKNRLKAIRLCLNRFDDETKTAFLDFYTKIDENAIDSIETDAGEE